MKNLKFLYILSAALLISTSCEQELIELTPPEVVTPVDSGTPGSASFTKFVAIGNSFVAGVQGGALFTAGQNNSLDKVIVVHSPVEVRVARVLQRDLQRTESEIRDIIARQMSDEERLKIADYVVYNDDSQLLIPQVWHLHQLFSKR